MPAVLAMVLSALPPANLPPAVTPPPIVRGATAPLRVRLDLGGLLGAPWFVPQGRAHIEAVLANARGSLRGESAFDLDGVLLAAPAVGPLLLAAREGSLGSEDRALLIVSGALQLFGLSLGATALAAGEADAAGGAVLSFSPIAGGRLGLSVRLSGF